MVFKKLGGCVCYPFGRVQHLDDNAASEFVSGTLSPSALGKVESHLASCRECRALVAALAADPRLEVTVDLEAEQLSARGVPTAPFAIDRFARRCLLDGVDELGFLLQHLPEIESHERRH